MEHPTLHTPVLRLLPAPAGPVALHGLYLQHRLHALAASRDRPFVYSNFVSSLDGRIALEVPGKTTHTVPGSIANPRDWRLYQELSGQADILLTSGRFFRQSKAGEAQDVLPVGGQPEFNDIRAWRTAQGLRPQPDILILSSSLDIPPAALEPYRSRRILIATGSHADAARAAQLRDSGIEVVTAGQDSRVNGKLLLELLGARGYRTVYAVAGPAVLHTLVEGDVLDRLYLTFAHRLLAGEAFDTLTRGAPFVPPVNLQLRELYYDATTPEAAGQLFCVYDSAARA
jgi:riboflavin biosynthesis pyrimidine reductase